MTTSRTVRLFISSTFSDMAHERRILHDEVFPELQKLCASHGAQFQAVDLRWGVNEDSQLDHKTMDICLGEIERCQRLSPKPNFLVLLGDRYGWEPVPARIPSSEFEDIRAKANAKQGKLLDEWYIRDDNAVPPHHALKRRDENFDEYHEWAPEEERLREAVRSLVDKAGIEGNSRDKYFHSATHQEIELGALNSPTVPENTVDPAEHVLVCFRTIEGLDRTPVLGTCAEGKDIQNPFVDQNNRESELTTLKTTLRSRLERTAPATDNAFDYAATWAPAEPTKGDIKLHAEQAFADRVVSHFERLIEAQIETLDTPTELEQERRDQERVREELCTGFVGRTGELKAIKTHLATEGSGHRPTDRRTLVLLGPEGIGKSALMAEAVRQADEDEDLTVFYRFLGASKGSQKLQDVLKGFLAEVVKAERGDESPPPLKGFDPDSLPAFACWVGEISMKSREGRPVPYSVCVETDGAVHFGKELENTERTWKEKELEDAQHPLGIWCAFRSGLSELAKYHPAKIALFIDALDQLPNVEDENLANWLEETRWPPGVHVIASGSDPFEQHFKNSTVHRIAGLPPEACKTMLNGWLRERKRKLQPDQVGTLVDALADTGSPTLARMLLADAVRLKSSESWPLPLPRTLDDALERTWDRWCRVHNSKTKDDQTVDTVGRSLAHLLASRRGLSEPELLGSLAKDKEFFVGFKESLHHDLPVEEVPIAVWSRMHRDWELYLTEAHQDGATLLRLFNRRAREFFAQKSLEPVEARTKAHQALATYFWEHFENELQVGNPVTGRVVDELPFHLARSGGAVRLGRLMSEFEFLAAAAESRRIEQIYADGSELPEHRDHVDNEWRLFHLHAGAILKYAERNHRADNFLIQLAMDTGGPVENAARLWWAKFPEKTVLRLGAHSLRPSPLIVAVNRCFGAGSQRPTAVSWSNYLVECTDLTDLEPSRKPVEHHGRVHGGVEVPRPDGGLFATWSNSNRAEFLAWDPYTDAPPIALEKMEWSPILEKQVSEKTVWKVIDAVAVNDASGRLVVCYRPARMRRGSGLLLRVWCAATGALRAEFDLPFDLAISGIIPVPAPDALHVVVWSRKQGVVSCNTATGTVTVATEAPVQFVTATSQQADRTPKRFLIAVVKDLPLVWDLKTNDCTVCACPIRPVEAFPVSFEAQPTASLLVSDGRGRAILMDDQGNTLQQLKLNEGGRERPRRNTIVAVHPVPGDPDGCLIIQQHAARDASVQYWRQAAPQQQTGMFGGSAPSSAESAELLPQWSTSLSFHHRAQGALGSVVIKTSDPENWIAVVWLGAFIQMVSRDGIANSLGQYGEPIQGLDRLPAGKVLLRHADNGRLMSLSDLLNPGTALKRYDQLFSLYGHGAPPSVYAFGGEAWSALDGHGETIAEGAQPDWDRATNALRIEGEDGRVFDVVWAEKGGLAAFDACVGHERTLITGPSDRVSVVSSSRWNQHAAVVYTSGPKAHIWSLDTNAVVHSWMPFGEQGRVGGAVSWEDGQAQPMIVSWWGEPTRDVQVRRPDGTIAALNAPGSRLGREAPADTRLHVRQGENEWWLEGHSSPVLGLKVVPVPSEADLLVSWSEDGLMLLWRPGDRTPCKRIMLGGMVIRQTAVVTRAGGETVLMARTKRGEMMAWRMPSMVPVLLPEDQIRERLRTVSDPNRTIQGTRLVESNRVLRVENRNGPIGFWFPIGRVKQACLLETGTIMGLDTDGNVFRVRPETFDGQVDAATVQRMLEPLPPLVVPPAVSTVFEQVRNASSLADALRRASRDEQRVLFYPSAGHGDRLPVDLRTRHATVVLSNQSADPRRAEGQATKIQAALGDATLLGKWQDGALFQTEGSTAFAFSIENSEALAAIRNAGLPIHTLFVHNDGCMEGGNFECVLQRPFLSKVLEIAAPEGLTLYKSPVHRTGTWDIGTPTGTQINGMDEVRIDRAHRPDQRDRIRANRTQPPPTVSQWERPGLRVTLEHDSITNHIDELDGFMVSRRVLSSVGRDDAQRARGAKKGRRTVQVLVRKETGPRSVEAGAMPPLKPERVQHGLWASVDEWLNTWDVSDQVRGFTKERCISEDQNFRSLCEKYGLSRDRALQIESGAQEHFRTGCVDLRARLEWWLTYACQADEEPTLRQLERNNTWFEGTAARPKAMEKLLELLDLPFEIGTRDASPPPHVTLSPRFFRCIPASRHDSGDTARHLLDTAVERGWNILGTTAFGGGRHEPMMRVFESFAASENQEKIWIRIFHLDADDFPDVRDRFTAEPA